MPYFYCPLQDKSRFYEVSNFFSLKEYYLDNAQNDKAEGEKQMENF